MIICTVHKYLAHSFECNDSCTVTLKHDEPQIIFEFVGQSWNIAHNSILKGVNDIDRRPLTKTCLIIFVVLGRAGHIYHWMLNILYLDGLNRK